LNLKFAAIDIGSNAIRLLLARVIESDGYDFLKKESLIRMPIRLGEDAFTSQLISTQKTESLINTMTGFKYLIDAYNPLDISACATSAMREASNGNEIIKKVQQQSGIKIDIIDGKKEANIIFSNHIERRLEKNHPYLYIDVGGGSTELTLFCENKPEESKSFNIGTVRLLQNLVDKSTWDDMKVWVKYITGSFKLITAIGSGGNINKIFRLTTKKENKPLSYKNVNDIHEELKSYSFEERISIIGLRPDRADVILPASEIYLSVMRWARIKKILVPQVGLADGLVHIMYENYKNNQINNQSFRGKNGQFRNYIHESEIK
jgi:exopolyphosphatase / guanosine-5'-triphosphate,3'-diphosphate pyrophosphatase